MRWVSFSASTVAVILGTISYANGQELDDADGFVLDEIVIEGGKIDRAYEDTFGSVGVIGGDAIEAQGIDDLREGFSLLGNVRWNEGNRGNAGFSIRGVNSDGLTEPQNNNPVTAVIIDGATQSLEATRRGSRGIWDVEQVEVFRGPQSAIQGRAALAGAVIVSTRDPTFEWEAAAQGTLGTLDQRDGAFYLSGPIIDDQVAFRVSGEWRNRTNGITYNSPFAQEFEDDEFYSLRGKVLIEPSEIPGLSLLFTAVQTFDRPAVNSVNINPAIPGNDSFFDRRFSVTAFSTVEVYEATNRNFILEGSYEFSPTLTLRSLSSFVLSDTEISTPQSQLYQRSENREGRDFTQDLRVEIGESEDRLSGVIGAYYGLFTLPRDSVVRAGPNVLQDLESDNETEHLSIYADLRVRPFEQYSDVSFIIGGRLLRETVVNDFNDRGPANNDILAEASFTEFLPKLGLAYDINELTTISAVYQRGYRSGFTGSDAANNGAIYTVDPEYADSFELGFKTRSDDGRWNFGATGFFTRYTDQQIAQSGTRLVAGATVPFARTLNAGESTSIGLELEGQYDFGNGLSVFGSVGLLRTEFDTLVVNGVDLSGNEFPEAPSLTASLGFAYNHDSGFFATANAAYTDSFFSNGSITNDPTQFLSHYWVVNASAGFERDHVKATVFVDNVFDEEYITGITRGGAEASLGAERRMGAEVRVSF